MPLRTSDYPMYQLLLNMRFVHAPDWEAELSDIELTHSAVDCTKFGLL